MLGLRARGAPLTVLLAVEVLHPVARCFILAEGVLVLLGVERGLFVPVRDLPFELVDYQYSKGLEWRDKVTNA